MGLKQSPAQKSGNPGDGKSDLRKFGLKLGLFLLLSGAMAFHKHWFLYEVCDGLGIIFLLPALVFPMALRPVRIGLQKLSHGAGTVVTVSILTFVYFAVMVPLGGTAKLFGKKFLDLKPKDPGESYWTRKENIPSKKSMERGY
jgi:hypothetical protein